MATTYEAIATVTVGAGGASNIEFTSIPNTFTDIAIKLSARWDQSGGIDYVYLQFNNDTSTSNYKSLFVRGNGSTTASSSATSEGKIRAAVLTSTSETASTFSNCEIYVPNYGSSNQKSTSSDWVGENNATATFMGLTAGLWTGTSAITSIKLTPPSNNFVQYSTATLYGIKNS